MHPQIAHPYILVTHGEYSESISERQLDYLDDPQVIAWFGIHPCEKKHPKYRPIPLGILQHPLNYKKREKLNDIFAELRTVEKKHCVYMNFADEQKPERQKIKQFLGHKPYCKRGARQPFLSYIHEMAECAFTLAPRGMGPDTYRLWEALLVGSIPIVKSSQIDQLLQGLPVIIVSHWNEINESFLQQEYKKITSKKYSLKRLYMDYWLAKIKRTQERFLAKYNKEKSHDTSAHTK